MGLFNIVGFILTGYIVLVCFFAGSVKLTDKIDPETTATLSVKFDTEYINVWNLKQFGITGDQFRQFVGFCEVISAIGLLLAPSSLFPLFLLGVITIFSGAVYTDLSTHSPLILPGSVLISAILRFLLLFVTSSGSSSKTKQH